MNKEDAIKYLQQLYPNGGHCWLDEQRIEAIGIAIKALQEEPVKDRFTFKAITRLLDMIEPTDRAKSYVGKLADSFDSEGYHTDAKIVRESLKIMNGEKVPMATMDEEPVSEDLGNYINELSKQFPEMSFAKLSRIAVRVAKWQKEQFEKNRLAHCDELTAEQAQIESDFVIEHLKENSRTPTFIDAIKYGMRLKEQQLMSKAIDAHCFRFQGAALFSFRLPADKYLVGSKVKVIVINED